MFQVMGTVDRACKDILDNSNPSQAKALFCFSMNSPLSPVYTASSVKTWSNDFGVEKLKWPKQSPDLKPNEHYWDKLDP